MGRHAEGWKLKTKRGWYYVHFTHEHTPYRIPLFTKDPGEASERAQTEYAAVIGGRKRIEPGIVRHYTAAGSRPLDVLIAEWIASTEGALDEATRATLVTYGRHFIAYFKTIDGMTEPACKAYGTTRLRMVLRDTVQKELGYLRAFLSWAEGAKEIAKAPAVAVLPKKATGKRAGKQRARPVDITPEQAESILAQLPITSKTIKGRRWPIRDRFSFMWETTLRPETLNRLSVPEHWRPGKVTLVLENEDDKARYGRELPLTTRAVSILMRCVPPGGRGLLFGRSNFRKAIKHAGKAVLGEEDGAKFAPYDFRHGRGAQIANSPGAPLLGVSFVMGHQHATTTDKYLRGTKRTGEQALAAVGAVAQPAPPSGSGPNIRPISAPELFSGNAAPANHQGNQGWPTRLELATPGATTQRRDEKPNDYGPPLRQETPPNDPSRHDSRTGCGYSEPWSAARWERLRAVLGRLPNGGPDEP